jgi:phosphinothricin acetyltransferase
MVRSKKQQGLSHFVAEEEAAIVGFSSIGPFRAWAAYKYSVENSVYVKASERGRELKVIDAAVDRVGKEYENSHDSCGN